MEIKKEIGFQLRRRKISNEMGKSVKTMLQYEIIAGIKISVFNFKATLK
jgi:hypothetical protein